ARSRGLGEARGAAAPDDPHAFDRRRLAARPGARRQSRAVRGRVRPGLVARQATDRTAAFRIPRVGGRLFEEARQGAGRHPRAAAAHARRVARAGGTPDRHPRGREAFLTLCVT
ncbi:hypothetical protein QU38_02470, partial [Staphylococcus aureus]